MDAVEYLRTKARMTSKCGIPCSECLLNAEDDANCGCDKLEYEDPEKAVERMEVWLVEHPVNTRQRELLKLFPRAKSQADTGVLRICPQTVDTEFECTGESIKCCSSCRSKYWLTEINTINDNVDNTRVN